MKTLKSIFLFCVLNSTYCIHSNAQIIYTDVNPDSSINYNGGTYNLDLDNDGIIDFSLNNNSNALGHCSSPMSPLKKIKTAKVSALAAGTSFANHSSNPSGINYGDLIDNNLNWSNGVVTDTLKAFLRLSCLPGTSIGNWVSHTDRYLPLRKTIGINNYYGWIRMIVYVEEFSSEFIIKDYAYNPNPNQFILAGDSGAVPTGIIKNIVSSSTNIFPNPATNNFTIALCGRNNVELSITDITGKIIYSNTVRETRRIDMNTNDFAGGIYLVHIKTSEFIETKKLIVER